MKKTVFSVPGKNHSSPPPDLSNGIIGEVHHSSSRFNRSVSHLFSTVNNSHHIPLCKKHCYLILFILKYSRFKKELKYLCHHEFSNSFWKSTFLTGQNHFQHIAMQLFHYYKNSFRSFKHAFQVYNPRMVQILKSCRMFI